ncbi:MAG: tRNA (N6-isopentenyl adenosine(37)-C2)-methylthiotransferase MiaB [Rikenellaceae bacterium]
MRFKELKLITESNQKLHIETFGCQMNVVDSELVVSIMKDHGFGYTEVQKDADVILLNTCSIRDNAEQKIWSRLRELGALKRKKRHLLIGIIGCMAERLKDSLLENKTVDIVVGPDGYRTLPELIKAASGGDRGVNVVLSGEETYGEISPVRLDKSGISAFVAIMRGCNNMCTYCVVPYTRGRERSRNPITIVNEVRELVEDGYKEVTLLGQNVNSYNWEMDGQIVSFPELIRMVAKISPQLRVRFATSHPKDLSDELIDVIATYSNVCKSIHLPVQSGSDMMLQKMNRKYNIEWYRQRIRAIKASIEDCAITTDIIAGFCGESEQDHQDTLAIMREVGYDFAFMFKYSDRPGTKAHRTMEDDVDEKVKVARLTEIVNLQNSLSLESNKRDIGKVFEVLVEGSSKRNSEENFGRTSQNKVVVFPKLHSQPGDYVNVKIEECSSATLKGVII